MCGLAHDSGAAHNPSGGAAMAMTLGECAREYINSRWSRGEISSETRRSFRESLSILRSALGDTRRLSSIERRDVERWLGSMNCSPATVRLRLSTVRGMFKWAVVEGYAKTDPTIGIRGPKKPRSVPRGLSSVDVDALLTTARDARERLLLMLMVEEGLRSVEISRLQMGDLDLGGRTMIVRGKGGHSRVLPITDTAGAALTAYLAERGRGSGSLLKSYQRSWASEDDGLSAKYVARIAGDAFRRAGIDESGHALRHTFAHGLIDAGASIRDVQGALGHASMTTTQVYLGHAEVAQLRNFMGKRTTDAVA